MFCLLLFQHAGSYVAMASSIVFAIQCFLASVYILFLSWRGLRRYSSPHNQAYCRISQVNTAGFLLLSPSLKTTSLYTKKNHTAERCFKTKSTTIKLCGWSDFVLHKGDNWHICQTGICDRHVLNYSICIIYKWLYSNTPGMLFS